jgi:glycosyltransferase involved in cell wall biosynthesis
MKKNLVFILDKLRMGGAERHTLGLANALAPDFDCTILAYDDEANSSGALLQGYDLPIRFMGDRRLFDPAAWSHLSRALRNEAPDVIVAVNQTPLMSAVIAGAFRPLGAPLAWVQHADPSHQRTAWEHRLQPLLRWCAARTDLIFYVSENQRHNWKARGFHAHAATVVHNGVPLAHFTSFDREAARSEARGSFGFDPEDVVFGVCASLRPEKNHAGFATAVAALRRRGRPAKGLLVGSGPLRAEIVQQLDSLGLAQAVMLAGEVADVRPFLSAMDVGVLSSHAETFSLAALEFMAMGLPTIMTEVGGAAEMVESGQQGVLYRTGDQPALEHALEQLLEPYARRRMGSAALARVEAEFSYAAMVDKYRAALQRLAGA